MKHLHVLEPDHMTKAKEEKKLSVRLAIRDHEVSRTLEEIVNGLDFCYLQKNTKASHADILVLETGGNPTAEFNTIQSLLQDGAVKAVFLTSSKATPEILVPALRIGARDFFQQPIVAREVTEAFRQVHAGNGSNESAPAPAGNKTGKTYCVLGAKGGVGTTTFAVNLAISLNAIHPDKNVALVDMNRLLGEVPIFLDLDTTFNWEHLTKNIKRLDSTYLQRALVRHTSGLYVMPAPNKVGSGTELSSKDMLEVLEKTRSTFDFIVIDGGTHLDGISFQIFNQSDKLFLISILSLPCLVNVKRLRESMNTFGQIDADKVKIIANRFEKKGVISISEAEQVILNNFFYTIPNDYQSTMEAINAGKPLLDVAPSSKVEKSYIDLAALITGASPSTRKTRKKWFW